MANKNITFDPNAGVSYGANVTINTGATFEETFKVKNTDKTNFDFTGYSGSSQMRKSTGTGSTTVAAATFTVGFTSAADGKIRVSYGATQTGELSAGRYVYNVLISTGSTVYNIIDGNIMVYAGISSSPGSA